MRRTYRLFQIRHAGSKSLRPLHYSYWEVGRHSWGEAVWSILHRAPIRTGIIPERARLVLNLWGPAGRLKNTRFNTYK